MCLCAVTLNCLTFPCLCAQGCLYIHPKVRVWSFHKSTQFVPKPLQAEAVSARGMGESLRISCDLEEGENMLLTCVQSRHALSAPHLWVAQAAEGKSLCSVVSGWCIGITCLIAESIS